jgi:nucleotide-binding universal stress UspA family protein
MYRTIVVGLDGSPREPLVLRTALDLARLHGAKLHLCRAVSIPIGLPDAVWSVSMAQLDVALMDEAKRALAAAAAQGAELVAGTHAVLGQPADVIEDVAKHENADLVVIGAHGYGAIERLLGTTASKIVHRSTCSVLVVREAAATK